MEPTTHVTHDFIPMAPIPWSPPIKPPNFVLKKEEKKTEERESKEKKEESKKESKKEKKEKEREGKLQSQVSPLHHLLFSR